MHTCPNVPDSCSPPWKCRLGVILCCSLQCDDVNKQVNNQCGNNYGLTDKGFFWDDAGTDIREQENFDI